MKIWDAVSKTDPAHTKTVNQRGGFTAIGANYQIKMATEQFGPIGIGWGYDCGEPIFTGPFIIVPVTMWHSGDRANKFGPILGCAEIAGKRPDSDAPKKATTDGVTKALSQLGFNADVFLGQFDDNKYVQQREREEEQKPVDEAIEGIEHCNSVAVLQEYYISLFRSDQRTAEQARVIAAKDARKLELSQ